ncbi:MULTISPECIES: glycerol kinase GlpK [unclassified Meiothermus]|uniref:glycerol kinase GlpK n=1 Tax=unclassified Meiothermus TaxID=370471 RepID=UPI000D7C44D5|nr:MULTISPECIES: glycerol kinase GlpK [unclassified Meiothermus]PZA07248.1 glycerol kinase [Meiothermus sp. Pnk-1]RYM37982.1 glycerol kinase [Meiothermus sp. PNK-Is4]
MPYLLALDQGTTSSRAIVFDLEGRPLAQAQQEFTQHFPQPGLVEHDPLEIWQSQIQTAREAIRRSGVAPAEIAAIGITNQRETVVLWERATGKPVHRAIVWQDRRTAGICEELKQRGYEEVFRQKSGLVLDPYFSGTKLKWLLDEVPGLRERAGKGELCFGTVDSWLIYNLTGGQVHATDVSNASRTLLFNLQTLEWDPHLLGVLGIPKAVLPQVRPSAGVYGHTVRELLGASIPIAGVAGDQQAALFGQACFAAGMAKNTYGTGCFLLMNTGPKPVASGRGLLSTVAWQLEGEGPEYALEGSVFIAGAVVQWLRDGLGIIQRSGEVEALAKSVPGTDGVYLVPAFVGLGAPYWDAYARGTIVGLTRGSTKAHLARAALEAIAYQTKDVLAAMEADSGLRLSELRVDGGASVNELLMQFQADLLGRAVLRPQVTETTALGAAYLAAIGVGALDRAQIAERWAVDRRFEPQMSEEERTRLYAGWQKAVERARGWAQ